jgi:sodium-dependent dicarboxylate transporter 2/3/5
MSHPDDASRRIVPAEGCNGPEPIETVSAAERAFERWRRTVSLLLGPLTFVALLLAPPDGLQPEAARLLAVLAWVVLWWIGEAVPLAITAVLGPALATVLGVGTAVEIFAPFGDPIIFLFLGSFILAEAMVATGLDRRVALAVLSRRWVGASPARIILAMACITAGLSMWMSNTASTAMLYPIALSVLVAVAGLLGRALGAPVDPRRLRFGTALMLVTAYASSIGGTGTPVGSPPNLIAIGQLATLAGTRISFFEYTLIAMPVTLSMVGVLVLYLRLALPPEVRRIEGAQDYVLSQRALLGRLTRGERNVLAAFAITVTLWLTPGVVAVVAGGGSRAAVAVQSALPEGVVAVLGAAILFVLPLDWRERRFTIEWSRAARIDWGTLLLFGGGLSLGAAMFRTGLAQAIGDALVSLTGARSGPALTFLFCALAIVLTETASNTAAATMVCPLAIAAAQTAGVSPVAPALAVGLGASMAFMLPVSTPPNAIVYGSGCVPVTTMVRHGAALDLASLILIPPITLAMCALLGL